MAWRSSTNQQQQRDKNKNEEEEEEEEEEEPEQEPKPQPVTICSSGAHVLVRTHPSLKIKRSKHICNKGRDIADTKTSN